MPTRHVARPAAVIAAALLAGLPDLAAAGAPAERARDGLTLVEGAVPGKVRGAPPVAPTTVAPVAPAAPASPVAPVVADRSELEAIRVGVTAGLDLADGFTGVGAHPQVAYTAAALGPRLHLDLAGHLGIAAGGATGYSGYYFALIPAVRLRYDLGSRFALYGDMGVGFFVLQTSLDNGLDSDTQAGAVLRLPVGLRYALSRSLDLVFEPAGLNMYFNTAGNRFHYSFLVGFLVKV